MKRVTPFRLSQKKALAIVRETARESWRVIISDHARKRMHQRRILRTQVDRCLMFGHIIEGPTKNDQGGWSIVLEVMTAGDEVVVVCELWQDEEGRWVTVVTTYRGD